MPIRFPDEQMVVVVTPQGVVEVVELGEVTADDVQLTSPSMSMDAMKYWKEKIADFQAKGFPLTLARKSLYVNLEYLD